MNENLAVTQGDTGGWGFVYFNDGTRIGFAADTEGTMGRHGMFAANWGGNTFEHFIRAEAWLDEHRVAA